MAMLFRRRGSQPTTSRPTHRRGLSKDTISRPTEILPFGTGHKLDYALISLKEAAARKSDEQPRPPFEQIHRRNRSEPLLSLPGIKDHDKPTLTSSIMVQSYGDTALSDMRRRQSEKRESDSLYLATETYYFTISTSPTPTTGAPPASQVRVVSDALSDGPLSFEGFILEADLELHESARDDNSLIRPLSFLEHTFPQDERREIDQRFKAYKQNSKESVGSNLSDFEGGSDSPSTMETALIIPVESPEERQEEDHFRFTIEMVLTALRDHEQVIMEDDASSPSLYPEEESTPVPLTWTVEDEVTEEDFVERVLRESIVVRRHTRQRSEEEQRLVESRRNAVLISDDDMGFLSSVIMDGAFLADEPDALDVGVDQNCVATHHRSSRF
ncbi:hypothetical protein PIIN_08943 [Serendipita indica DSM 11827]|uniref:Uncharacterized protein n=1 Tax=Serendipita indica (strain DSM 11827) TaxID=1109443 RepID=G4TUH0_SERID|nr:hypothetical protein PIIN_08943 [Serendipita indica DSM 11827]